MSDKRRGGGRGTEGVFEMVVKAFQHPIGLCVECCGSDVENVQKGPEGRSELNGTVRCDGVRYAKSADHCRTQCFCTVCGIILVSGIASARRVLFTVAKMCVKPLSLEVVLPHCK